MNRVLISELWHGSNAIKSKAVECWGKYCTNKNVDRSFKQYCNTSEGKANIKLYSERYINKAKEDMNIKFVDAYVKDDELYIVLDTDVSNVALLLSYKCNTSLGFMDVSYKLDYVS